MTTGRYVTIPELARLLGVSRIAIYNRVKKGQIPATRIGRNYFITDQTIADILGKKTSEERKKRLDVAVEKTVHEYGEVLKLLGNE